MSLKGIDSQMMITRGAEYSKDNSIAMKRDELTQDFLAVQAKAMQEREQKSVTKPDEAYRAEFHKDGDGQGDTYESSGDGQKQDDEDSSPEVLVPAGDNIIDIKI